jgi:predicted transposase YdaD
MSKQWDILTKKLLQANPQALISWVLTGATYQGELNVELQKKDPISADLLYTVNCNEEQMVLHIEIQRQRDEEMGRRVWEYNCLASIHTGLPVYSLVIYLVKQHSIVNPLYEMKVPMGLTVHRFLFQNIKLWEIPPEVFKQENLSGLLPLLPLTKGGKRPEIVDEMIESLQQAGKTDLLPLAYAISALTFKKKHERQWLKERFANMEDILEGSWAYQEMVQKAAAKSLKQGLEQGKQQGLEQGKQQGLEQGKKDMERTLVRFVELHFPDLGPLAKQQAIQAPTSQQLQDMLDQLFVAHTADEAKAILLGQPQ